MPGESDREFRRSRMERQRLVELGRSMRMDNERNVRLVLDKFFPAGIPDGLVEQICRVQNALIREVVQGDKVIRELHDGINRISDEAARRETRGYDLCVEQVRTHADELGLDPEVTDSLLRNHVRMREAERAERDRTASRKVEWLRS
jgi:hypothetical protein